MKVTKAAAEYRDKPNGRERCSGCKHFEPPQSCEGVAGVISPSGWCKRFKAKGRNWYGKKD